MQLHRLVSVLFLVVLFATRTFNAFAQSVPGQESIKLEGNAVSAVEYWTPERMKNARPMTVLRTPEPSSSFPLPAKIDIERKSPGRAPSKLSGSITSLQTAFDTQPTLTENGVPILDYSYPYPYNRFNVLPMLYDGTITYPVYPYSAIGKLFFRLNTSECRERGCVCTASVIRRHLLITARHCIYDYASQQWATEVMFEPGYKNGSNPSLGNVWLANRLRTWTSNAPGDRWDIGFIQTLDDDGIGCGGSTGGHPIEDYTGWLGFWSGGDYSKRFWNQFGYPVRILDGQVMVESQSSTGALNGRPDTVEVGNDMGGGASGGPWILSFFPGQAGDMNYINGLDSFHFDARPMAANSPQFLDDNFIDLFNRALADPCP